MLFIQLFVIRFFVVCDLKHLIIIIYFYNFKSRSQLSTLVPFEMNYVSLLWALGSKIQHHYLILLARLGNRDFDINGTGHRVLSPISIDLWY